MTAAILISLTSTSRRIARCPRVIRTLLDQTVKAPVVLWLSEEPHLLDEGVSPAMVPPDLRDLVGERFTIRWTHNLGPHRKLLPALKCHDGIVVTADDDTLYPPDWLARLLALHRTAPHTVCCFRARRMLGDGNGRLAAYWRWPGWDQSGPGLDCFPTGKDGVLYPPGALHSMVADEHKMLMLSPTDDDVWFKAAALRLKTPAKAPPLHDSFPVVSVAAHLNGLCARYNGLRNDRTLTGVFDAFGVFPLAQLAAA